MKPLQKKLAGVVLGAGLVFGGAAATAALTGVAGAQDQTTTTAASTAAAAPTAPTAPPQGMPGGPQGPHDPSKGGHVANGITEVVLTGDTATKATAAAQAAVPGGTIERVENDAEGAAYEAHAVDAAGNHVTVKMDANFAVTSVENGPA